MCQNPGHPEILLRTTARLSARLSQSIAILCFFFGFYLQVHLQKLLPLVLRFRTTGLVHCATRRTLPIFVHYLSRVVGNLKAVHSTRLELKASAASDGAVSCDADDRYTLRASFSTVKVAEACRKISRE